MGVFFLPPSGHLPGRTFSGWDYATINYRFLYITGSEACSGVAWLDGHPLRPELRYNELGPTLLVLLYRIRS